MSTVLAILKALPILQGWFESFIAYYVSRQIEQMKAENREAIRKAIELQDQRGIEDKLGSDRAGLPSGIPGTETRDKLPGVK